MAGTHPSAEAGHDIDGHGALREFLVWPPRTAAQLEALWTQRDHRYTLRGRSIAEHERTVITSAREDDVRSLLEPEQSKAWRTLARWVLPHI